MHPVKNIQTQTLLVCKALKIFCLCLNIFNILYKLRWSRKIFFISHFHFVDHIFLRKQYIEMIEIKPPYIVLLCTKCSGQQISSLFKHVSQFKFVKRNFRLFICCTDLLKKVKKFNVKLGLAFIYFAFKIFCLCLNVFNIS